MEADKARKLSNTLQKSWCELNPFYINRIYDFLIALPNEAAEDRISDMPGFQEIVENYNDWLADQ